jgi:galactose mutarotase-like enzyme
MLEIKTTKKGAELISAKLDGIEKIHDGESFWNRHSPVLFPIVGKLKDGKTSINGETFEMGQHGFARDMEFEEIAENSYVLKSNEETHKKFPFDFELYIWYEVKENELITNYKVVNKSDSLMIFGLGAHPAFVCNYSNGKYSLNFEKNEDKLEIVQLENGLISNEKIPLEKYFKDNKITFDNSTFDNDAVIMKNIKSNKVILKEEDKKVLEFDFTGFPYLAVWSKKDASFVCIEPWFNTADNVNSNGIFEEKEDLIELNSNKSFKANFSVKFF